jgi:hypothetical protein
VTRTTETDEIKDQVWHCEIRLQHMGLEVRYKYCRRDITTKLCCVLRLPGRVFGGTNVTSAVAPPYTRIMPYFVDFIGTKLE